jgi:glucans biosynthesis protein
MRLHLTMALITVLALVITLRANLHHPFTFAHVQQLAEQRAHTKFVPMPDVLPPQLKKLTPDQDRGIFSKETARLWRKKGLPFQVDFYPQLASNPLPHIAPAMNYIDRKGSHELPYSPTFFNFIDLLAKPPGPLVFNPPLPANLGYAGFYVRYPGMAIGSNPDSLDGFFSVLGGSYFRAIAKDQVYGLSARGLALNTLTPGKTEEFPYFTDWWLEEPQPNANALRLDALLDSPSVAGAYEFTVRPGSQTSIDIHASLYFRQPVDQVGIAPFSSMYLFGENAKDHFNDNVHPEIHDSDGVLVNTSSGEWEWHPLQQTAFLQAYFFPDENPKGFGLIQRDRDFQHYQDLGDKYNVRPSVWVTPHGDWGKGKIALVQPNSNNVNTDNVAMFWSPGQAAKTGDKLDLSYTIDFYMNDAARPPLAYCKQTLINSPAPPPPPPPITTPPVLPATPATKAPAPSTPVPTATAATASKAPAKTPLAPAATPTVTAPAIPPLPAPPTGTIPVQFLVDFAGNGIENIPANQPPDLDLSYTPPGTFLREKNVEKNGYDGSWRATFTIIPLKHFVPTVMRCRLMHNNKPLTETWVYTLHQ